MNLFEKIDQFEKMAQESAKPSQIIKSAAQIMLNKLNNNPSVPSEEKTKLNRLGNILEDFIGNRFPSSEMDVKWDHYLAALMNKINGLVKTALSEELGHFYAELAGIASTAWDKILSSSSIMGGDSYLNKPGIAVWVDRAEDPWAAKPGDAMNQIDIAKKMKEREEEASKGMALKTSRQDRIQKLAKLNKSL